MDRLKVLLADDHDGFRRTVAGFLSLQQGVEVVAEAVDGNEAIEQTVRHRPDLVLIDINMPYRSGLEAAQAIKAQLPLTKVVIVSLNAGETYRHMAQQHCADYFIDKASMKSSLLLIVSGLLSGTSNTLAGAHAV
ncbi:MAG: response regulator transcription factor [Bacteroidota bacterium]